MSIILLMGLKAAGKTTLGRLLAKSLSFQFIDLDEKISKETSMSVRHFYEKYGKKAFQEIEARVLKDCFNTAFNKTIISTGGGLIENANARIILKEKISSNIKIFFLHNKPKILFNRLLKKAKKEHSLPAFLQPPISKDFCFQIKYAKMKFLLIYKERIALLKQVNCIKLKTKGLNAKKIIRMIRRLL